MSRRATNLSITIIATLIGAVSALTPSAGTILRALFAVPFALFLPGYALAKFLLPTQTLGFVERLTLSLGLSLAISVLTGLLLNISPWGLQVESWTYLLGGMTICLTVAANIRSKRVLINPTWPLRINVRTGLLFALTGLVVVAAIAIASLGAIRQRTPGFTQLWILPIDDAAANKVVLGIRNYEGTVVSYQLKLMAGEAFLMEFPTIEIESGGKWETVVNVPPEYEGAQAVEAELYRLDDPETIYRRVILWRNE